MCIKYVNNKIEWAQPKKKHRVSSRLMIKCITLNNDNDNEFLFRRMNRKKNSYT